MTFVNYNRRQAFGECPLREEGVERRVLEAHFRRGEYHIELLVNELLKCPCHPLYHFPINDRTHRLQRLRPSIRVYNRRF